MNLHNSSWKCLFFNASVKAIFPDEAVRAIDPNQGKTGLRTPAKDL
jgi:hypothetical protein